MVEGLKSFKYRTVLEGNTLKPVKNNHHMVDSQFTLKEQRLSRIKQTFSVIFQDKATKLHPTETAICNLKLSLSIFNQNKLKNIQTIKVKLKKLSSIKEIKALN